MLSLFGVPVVAAYHVVSAFAQLLAPVAGGLATAAAIVAFTMAVRLLLLPLSYRATRGLASQARRQRGQRLGESRHDVVGGADDDAEKWEHDRNLQRCTE